MYILLWIISFWVKLELNLTEVGSDLIRACLFNYKSGNEKCVRRFHEVFYMVSHMVVNFKCDGTFYELANGSYIL